MSSESIAPQNLHSERDLPKWPVFVGVQILLVGSFAIAYAAISEAGRREVAELVTQKEQPILSEIKREKPLSVPSLYNDPEVVSDEELAAVLEKILPRFGKTNVKPNYVEHALRLWSIHAKFPNHPEAMSGEAMKTFLTDHGSYVDLVGEADGPLLVEDPSGIAIRYGPTDGASIHHDHWLASLTEAGTPRDEPVFAPGRRTTLDGVIQESLWGFELDETEVEWSAMAFGLWLPPQRSWVTKENREITFDMLADRLINGACQWGVCHGTHRVYSLMLLWRLDQEYDILTDDAEARVWAHLERIRDMIIVNQFDDGHWPSNWYEGASAKTDPIDDEEYRKIIATGHHLEWLAIAPKELHPPREMIRKAADFIIKDTTSHTSDEILEKFTFYSHVGRALALWRSTDAHTFWEQHAAKQ